MKKLMIGGTALVKLGSSRQTDDIYYLINDTDSDEMFIHDKENNIDYVNANGHDFYGEIWEMESDNIGEIASPKALLELKAFAFVQHCKHGFWDKANDAEFDIKYLVGKYNLTDMPILRRYITDGELKEVKKVISSVRK